MANQVFTAWLLGEGLDPHETTHYRHTGFHIACMHGHKALASWLLTLGLSKDALDHQGNNALDLVNLYGDHAKQQMCKYLLSIGLQTKAVRQKSQHPSLTPSHTTLFSSVGSATIKEQAVRSPIYGNVFAAKEEEGMAIYLCYHGLHEKERKRGLPPPSSK